VIETDPDYEPEGSVPPKLPFLRRYAKPAPPRTPASTKVPKRNARAPLPRSAPPVRRAALVSPGASATPTRQPATTPAGPPPPYAASPVSPPTTTKILPLDPSLKPGEKDPNRSIKLDMTRPYLR
jgi:hypothetical protein